MLGNAADHFMLSQMRERVSAMSPNAGGRSFAPPDQERAGTATVRARGGLQLPGPQRYVSSNYSPGIQPSGALPGMGGFQPSGALPGMGSFQPSGALPGMGEEGAPPTSTVAVNIPPAVLFGWGALALGLVYFLSRPAKGGDTALVKAAPAIAN